MTAAFNLAQLANNLNTSGQLDATDGLTGALPVANGGSGRATLTANRLVAGNGTGQVNLIAPGSSGQALVSNGTSWAASSISQLSTATGAAPSYSLRAWVNFAGATGAINDSKNVSSVTKISVGNYGVNFVIAMANTAYTPVTNTTNAGSATHGYFSNNTPSTHAITCVRANVGSFDPSTCLCMIAG